VLQRSHLPLRNLHRVFAHNVDVRRDSRFQVRNGRRRSVRSRFRVGALQREQLVYCLRFIDRRLEIAELRSRRDRFGLMVLKKLALLL
jgi:hypothetical protein